MPQPDKRKVMNALLQLLTELSVKATNAANTTREGATHPEAKPENDKDTRALEQSYLARGQALRVIELNDEIQLLRTMPLRSFGAADPVAVGALVTLESEKDSRCVFLVPRGGGNELSIDGTTVFVVTPQSRLGAAVLGRTVDDDVELVVQGAKREYVVAAVS
ncbi:MAG: transcription elongation factor GreAB [Polyangiaceae bacterium]